jgi:ribosomal protein L34E
MDIDKLNLENQQLKEKIKKYEDLLATNKSKVSLVDAKGICLHKGPPPGLHECRECRTKKDCQHFGYYQNRIDKNGYLSRTNAVCNDCGVKLDKERKETLDKANKEGKIPPKPKGGDVCPKCERSWGSEEAPRNWHRDHDAIKNEFRGWLCGDCNMANHDHRYGTS